MQAVFWLLSEQQQAPVHGAEQGVSALMHYACILTADLYRQNKKILLATEDQDHAQLIDEWLWQFDAERFVPHNLPGEGPHYGTPVEINWEASKLRRQCFINVCKQVPTYHKDIKVITEWHDFVPADDAGKAAARERYKQLKQLGFELSTNQIPDSIV